MIPYISKLKTEFNSSSTLFIVPVPNCQKNLSSWFQTMSKVYQTLDTVSTKVEARTEPFHREMLVYYKSGCDRVTCLVLFNEAIVLLPPLRVTAGQNTVKTEDGLIR